MIKAKRDGTTKLRAMATSVLSRASQEDALADPLYRIDEAARVLNVKPKTLRNWASLGRIGFTRVGPRAVRIFASELNRVISEGHRPAREKDCA
jgi:excisionase family DNA binding protein